MKGIELNWNVECCCEKLKIQFGNFHLLSIASTQLYDYWPLYLGHSPNTCMTNQMGRSLGKRNIHQPIWGNNEVDNKICRWRPTIYEMRWSMNLVRQVSCCRPWKKKIYLKKKKFHICSSFFSAHKARRWRGRKKISFVKILFFFFLVKFLGPCSLPFLLPLPASCSLPSLDVVKLLNGHRHKNASVSWSLLQFFFSFVNGRVTVLYGPRRAPLK